jgi:hypothetical protein
VTPEAGEWAHRVADRVALLHPAAEGDVRITVESRDGVRRVTRLDVARLRPSPIPQSLLVDEAPEIALLSAELSGMLEALGQPAAAWSTETLIVGRRSVSVRGVEIPLDEGRRLFGEAFLARLQEIDAAISERQQRLQAAMTALGPCGTEWRRDEGRVAFRSSAGPATQIPAEVLGSFSPGMSSWCWAWANSSLDPRHVRAIAGVRDGGALPLFTAPGFACCDKLAFTVAYLAADALGTRPVWRWPLASGVQLFFAMSEERQWARESEA